MKVKVQRAEISSAIQTIMRAISTRSTQPILSNTLMEATDAGLRFTATDLELGLRTEIKAVVEERSSLSVPARILSDIISNMPSGEIELLQENENELIIRQARAKYSIRTLPASEYPLFPEMEEGDVCRLPADVLQKAIRQVIFAISQDETRPILTGVLLETEPGGLRLVATDGHRLASRFVAMTTETEGGVSLIIPGRALHELSRILSSGEEEVVIRVMSNQAAFIYGNVVLVSRIIEGSYPNYRQVIPGNLTWETVLPKEEFNKAVKGANILAREGSNVVRMKFGADRIAVTAVTQDVGDVYEEVAVEYNGEEMDVAFNSKYLLDVLNNLEESMVQFKTAGPLSPALIRPMEDENYAYVVMPVKMG